MEIAAAAAAEMAPDEGMDDRPAYGKHRQDLKDLEPKRARVKERICKLRRTCLGSPLFHQ